MKFVSILAIALVAFAVVGCGSSSSDDSSKPIAAPAGTTKPGAPAGAPSGAPSTPKTTTPGMPGK